MEGISFEEKTVKEKEEQDGEVKDKGVDNKRQYKDKKAVSNIVKNEKGISFIDYLLICLLCFLVSVISIFIYDRYFVPKIAVVDLEAYVNSLRYLYVTGKLSEKDLDKYMDIAVESIRDKKDRYVIFLGSVVVGRPKNVEYVALPEIPGAKDLRLEDLIKSLQGNALQGNFSMFQR